MFHLLILTWIIVWAFFISMHSCQQLEQIQWDNRDELTHATVMTNWFSVLGVRIKTLKPSRCPCVRIHGICTTPNAYYGIESFTDIILLAQELQRNAFKMSEESWRVWIDGGLYFSNHRGIRCTILNFDFYSTIPGQLYYVILRY